MVEALQKPNIISSIQSLYKQNHSQYLLAVLSASTNALRKCEVEHWAYNGNTFLKEKKTDLSLNFG